MKRMIAIIAAACCFALASSAQGRYDYAYGDGPRNPMALTQLDLHLGEGLGQGAGIIAGADLAFLHRFSPSFALGAGFGLDYVKGLDRITVTNGTKEADYWGELTLPLFLRGRYTFGRRGMIGRSYGYGRSSYYGEPYNPREGTHIFMQYDLGYRFGIAAYDFSSEGSAISHGNVHGLFFEPQVGVSVGRNASVSIGIPFQGYDKCTNVVTASGSGSEASCSSSYSTERRTLVAAVAHLTISW